MLKMKQRAHNNQRKTTHEKKDHINYKCGCVTTHKDSRRYIDMRRGAQSTHQTKKNSVFSREYSQNIMAMICVLVFRSQAIGPTKDTTCKPIGINVNTNEIAACESSHCAPNERSIFIEYVSTQIKAKKEEEKKMKSARTHARTAPK